MEDLDVNTSESSECNKNTVASLHLNRSTMSKTKQTQRVYSKVFSNNSERRLITASPMMYRDKKSLGVNGMMANLRNEGPELPDTF